MSLKVLFVSLGCDKNLVDTEKMLGLLSEHGFTVTNEEEEADAVVVNTCCFIGDAKEESISVLLQMAELRKSGSIRALVATGCLAQRYREEIMKEIPEVDAIIGTSAIEQILPVLCSILKLDCDSKCAEFAHVFDGNHGISAIADPSRNPVLSDRRIVSTGGFVAYLKIAEGCDKCCTYCVIPSVRGHYRSMPMERLVKEAEYLASCGIVELILVAQETTLYGTDLYGHKALHELLHALAQVEGIKWIRILYCYPEEVTDELIHAIASEPKVCHYLDIPIQHASDSVLKRMGRWTNQEQLRSVIGRLREAIPDICLRTTLISGFPGETQEDFEEVYRFVNEAEFDRLGVFTYSREEDTVAAEMPDQVSEKISAARRDELMELQQAVSADLAESHIGEVLEVIVEGRIPEENMLVCRTYRDAPGVDGYLFVETDADFMSGSFVTVRVTGAKEYDLIGELCDE